MKKIWIYAILIALLFGMLAINGCSGKKEALRIISIGTGSETGVYYPTGGAISTIVNKKSDEYNLKLSVEATAGSVYNIHGIMSGDMEIGMAQSDRQYQAYYGLAEWESTGARKDLRSMFSVHYESISLIVNETSGIEKLEDIKGKRINLGNAGSGQLQNSLDVLNAINLKENELSPLYVQATEAPKLLLNEMLDGFFYTVGHPNSNIKEASLGHTKIRIIPIDGPGIERMLKLFPYYARSFIPHDFYPKALNTEDINSIGVKATLVASKNTDEEIVYIIVKEVFENLEEFKELHPAYASLTKKSMLEALSAPLHKGAVKYFREAGLIDSIDKNLIIY